MGGYSNKLDCNLTPVDSGCIILDLTLHGFKLVNPLLSVSLPDLLQSFILVPPFFLVLHVEFVITGVILLLFLKILLKLLENNNTSSHTAVSRKLILHKSKRGRKKSAKR